MELAVVIPALNEEATIADVIRDIPQKMAGISKITAVVVDDGSSDRTADIASGNGAIIVKHSKNIGVGGAFQSGISRALELGADLIVNIDADGQFNPADIPILIEPIISGKTECTTASRFIKFFGNRLMSLLISFLVRKKYYDVSCGFRAYTRNALLNLNLVGGYTYTQEAILNFSFKGIDVLEVPIKIKGKRQYGESRVVSNVISYGYKSLKIISRSFRDYRPFIIFGSITLIMLFISFLLGIFLLRHYLATGMIFPHKWAGFSAGFFAMMGFFTFTTGLVADMLDRIRINQERVLYHLRQMQYTDIPKENGTNESD